MRMVGKNPRSLNAAPPTPREAWRRGRVLDAMLPLAPSFGRGVTRLTHAQQNSQDDARMLTVARRLKTLQTEDGAA